MARKVLGFDIWLTASNRVYRAVPYNVVADWLQQGRITADDQVRPEGGEWQAVAESAAFRAYLPQAEPARADDRAEALEPVALDVPIRRRHEDEDDEVDMIPLIDISLVLLIFFMMTATVAVGGSSIETPKTYHGVEMTSDATMIWIGADRAENGGAVFSIGEGAASATPEDEKLTLDAVLRKLDELVAARSKGSTVVRVAGHKQLAYGAIQKLTVELERRRALGRIADIKAEVNEKSS